MLHACVIITYVFSLRIIRHVTSNKFRFSNIQKVLSNWTLYKLNITIDGSKISQKTSRKSTESRLKNPNFRSKILQNLIPIITLYTRAIQYNGQPSLAAGQMVRRHC